MKQYLENLDSQILEGIRRGRLCHLPQSYGRISRICFFGMGGSAISGDILSVLSSGNVSFHVHRSPHFPKWAGRETLAVFSSYSGNTAETLTAFDQALKRNVKMLVVTSGGQLEKLAARKKIPVIKIPGGLPPRCAVGYLTFSLVPAFRQKGWIQAPDADIRETLSAVRSVSQAKARQLAGQMAGRFVHFYGMSCFMPPVLRRWRAQLAENAKTMSTSHMMPEMFHNEIEGWQFPKKEIKNHLMVFFTQKKGLSWLVRKMKHVQNIASQKSAGYLEIEARGRSILAQLFSLIVLGDWTSYELALLNGVDPLRIPHIEEVKKIL